MKKVVALTLAVLSLTVPVAHAQTQAQPIAMQARQDEAAIRGLLDAYRDALKSGNPAAVAALFTNNGVVMPPDAPTAIGTAELQATYTRIFSMVGLDLRFHIAEITVAGEYAFVRSTSDGTATIKAGNNLVPEKNRELFVLEKVGGQWKIARYMFNKTS